MEDVERSTRANDLESLLSGLRDSVVNIYFFRWLNSYPFFNGDREEDQSLVVGVGFPEQWLTEPGDHAYCPPSGPNCAAVVGGKPADFVDGTRVIVRKLPIVVDFGD